LIKGFTVDEQHRADAILDAVEAIDHCFPGTLIILQDVLKVTLPKESIPRYAKAASTPRLTTRTA